jgi:DNA-binding protein HU-beta
MSKIVNLSNADRVGKQYLVDSLVAGKGLARPDADEIVNIVLEAIATALRAGVNVSLSNIGTLRRETAPAATRRNPQTGGTVDVPAKEVVRWTASPTLLGVINGTIDRDSLSVKAPKGSLK